MEQADKQPKKQLPEALEKNKWKPGQSGNPNGRPKGKSLKEYWRERFESMTETEKEEFANKVNPELLWQMAEGRPPQNIDHTTGGKKINFGWED